MIATHRNMQAWIAIQQRNGWHSPLVQSLATTVICDLTACISNPPPHPAYPGFKKALAKNVEAFGHAMGR